MTPEKVLAALSNVQEPDLGKDIVTLNMVKDLEIEGNYVAFTVVLTTRRTLHEPLAFLVSGKGGGAGVGAVM